ncbi:hypothetical protein SBV1_1680006 [Verrucomicrobia bacterium]|nr:hypothetical protein SBV1_1680006 [Verrucomicrobiota bacterium]
MLKCRTVEVEKFHPAGDFVPGRVGLEAAGREGAMKVDFSSSKGGQWVLSYGVSGSLELRGRDVPAPERRWCAAGFPVATNLIPM